MTIVWSEAAKVAYEKLIDNLLERWEVDVAVNLENLVTELEENLKKNKHLCPESNKTGLRRCTVHPLTSLIYRVKGRIIEIITILDNRTEHDY